MNKDYVNKRLLKIWEDGETHELSDVIISLISKVSRETDFDFRTGGDGDEGEIIRDILTFVFKESNIGDDSDIYIKLKSYYNKMRTPNKLKDGEINE